MDFLKSVWKKISSFGKAIISIFAGIISILGFFFFVKRKLEEGEEVSFQKIDELEKNNEKIDAEITKNSGKIEFIEEKQDDLIAKLDEEIVDDSKNLEDFFDKRGFWCIVLYINYLNMLKILTYKKD